MAHVNRLATLPKRKAEFIEPMECAPVTKLLDGPGWFYEETVTHCPGAETVQ